MGLRPRRAARSRFRPDAADLRGVRHPARAVGLRGRLGCIGLCGLFHRRLTDLRGRFHSVGSCSCFCSCVLRGSVALRLGRSRFRRLTRRRAALRRIGRVRRSGGSRLGGVLRLHRADNPLRWRFRRRGEGSRSPNIPPRGGLNGVDLRPRRTARGRFRPDAADLRGSTALRLGRSRFRRLARRRAALRRAGCVRRSGALRGRLLRRSLCVRSRIVPLLPLRRGPYPLRRAVQRRLGRSLRHAAHRLHGGLRGRLCRFRQRQLRVGKRRSLGRYAPLRRPIGKRRCAACGRVFAPNISRNAFLGGPRRLSAHLPGKPLRAPAKPPRSGRRSARLGGCVLPDGLVKALADVHRRVGKGALLLLFPEPVDPGQQALLRLTPAAALLPPQRVEDHLHVQPDVLPRLRRGRLRPRRLLQKVQRGAAIPPLSRLRPVDQLLRKGLRQRAEGRQGRTLRVQRPHIRFCHPNGVHLHAPVIHKFDPVHRQLHLIAVELRAFVPDQMRSRHRPLPDRRAEAVL